MEEIEIAKDVESWEEYSGTRARVMASKLINTNDYSKFLKMDTNEIIRFLGEREYKKEVNAFGAVYSKTELIEEVLNQNFVNEMNKVLSVVPPHSLAQEYVKKWDIQNIKTVLRGKETNQPNSKIIRAIVPAGEYKKKFWEELVEKSKTRGDVIAFLEKTRYYPVLKKSASREMGNIENELDLFYYSKILELSKEFGAVHEVVQAEIDMRNVLTLLKIAGPGVKDAHKYFIPGGAIDVGFLNSIAKKEVVEIVNALKQKRIWKYAPTTSKELDKIESGLRKYLLLTGKKLLSDYNPGTATVLGYVLAKERELGNIRMIVKSKELPAEAAIGIKARLYLEA